MSIKEKFLSYYPSQSSLALYIDMDNFPKGKKAPDIATLIDFLAPWGKLSIRKAFGISLSSRKQIHNELLFHHFEIAEVPRMNNKKNCSDIHITIEVMDLIHSKKSINTIVLASGDGDFSSLVTRLHQQKIGVIGMGERASTSRELIKLCDVFLYYEDMQTTKDNFNITQIIPNSCSLKVGQKAMYTILRKRNLVPPTASIRKQILLRLQRIARTLQYPVNYYRLQQICMSTCSSFASKTMVKNVLFPLVKLGVITTTQQGEDKMITSIPDFNIMEKAHAQYQIDCLLEDPELIADPVMIATLVWDDPARANDIEKYTATKVI